MRKFREGDSCVLYHIDRIESQYGNIMIRGWVADLDPQEKTEISVVDGGGQNLAVYMERLVRPDVNAAVGKAADYESGIHILIDRAVLNTPSVWLTFTNGTKRQRVKIAVNASPVQRFVRTWVCRHGKVRAGQAGADGTPDYDLWIRMQVPDAVRRRRQRAQKFERMPLFSVVIPLYNTPERFLKEIVDSVLNQTYPKLELCLADGSSDARVHTFLRKHYAKDPRVRYHKLKQNRGISENTNAAVRMARGDFIVFSDHDDILTPDALYELAAAVNANPDADVLYSDEDKINRAGNAYFGPHFKPDFSMELLCCNNYICHLFAVKSELQKKVGLLNPAYDGAQDYDFVLRCAEQARQICHIPKVLYHWRTHPDSTAGNPASKEYAFEAGRRAVESHYHRVGIEARVERTGLRGRYRTRFALDDHPLVSILIPNKDHTEDLQRCLASIREKTMYDNYEIVIIENNSTEPKTEAFYEKLTAESEGQGTGAPARILRYEGAFNYAAIHNFAVPQARGTYLIFLNNDTEVLSPGWIEEMLGICQKPEVGAVGAKLYYPDGTIQHAGVVVGLCGAASHLFVGSAGDKDGYAGRLVSVQDYSAVTAACMMTKKAAYGLVGGMTEELAVAYNDIDYCLKLREEGFHVIFTPYAELTHYESKSRGLEDTKEKQERLQQEAKWFCRRWREVLEKGDPFYNPNLTMVKTDCSLRMPEEHTDRTGEIR